MKLRNLALIVLVLAVVAAFTWWFSRPPAPPEGSAFIGQAIIDETAAASITKVEIYERRAESPAVVLEKREGHWLVPGVANLPADFDKLSAMVQRFLESEVLREVTRDPARVERLEIGERRVLMSNTAGEVILDLATGRTATGGRGLFVRLDGADGPVLLLKESFFIDTRLDNWTEKQVIDWEITEVRAISFELPDGTVARFSRPDMTSDYVYEGDPEATVRQDQVRSLISTYLNARWREVQEDIQHPDVVAARANSRQVTLENAAGQRVSMIIGRRPADPTALPEPAPEGKDAENSDDAEAELPEAAKPGPVYVSCTISGASSPWQGVSDRVALQFQENLHNRLPDSLQGLLEAPTPPVPAMPATHPAWEGVPFALPPEPESSEPPAEPVPSPGG